jgi:hypothetical protein
MRDHTLSLPDEVLRIVLAWYRHDEKIEYKHHEALPMLTVCRRWNVRLLVTGRGRPLTKSSRQFRSFQLPSFIMISMLYV